MTTSLLAALDALAAAMPGTVTHVDDEERYGEVTGANNLRVSIHKVWTKPQFNARARFPLDSNKQEVRDYKDSPTEANMSVEKDADAIARDIMRRVVLPFLPILERSNKILAERTAYNNRVAEHVKAYEAMGFDVKGEISSPHFYGPEHTQVRIYDTTARVEFFSTSHDKMMRILAILAEK